MKGLLLTTACIIVLLLTGLTACYSTDLTKEGPKAHASKSETSGITPAAACASMGLELAKINKKGFTCAKTTQGLECKKKGGRWQAVGMSRIFACVIPTKDGGKSCTDSSQCERGCLAGDKTATSGQCQVNNMNFGCSSVITNGVSSMWECTD